MRLKSAIIVALITWGVIFACALGIGLYRHDTSLKSLFEYVWGTSVAVVLIGILARSGAACGDNIQRTEGVHATSLNREGFIQADNEDAALGMAFGTVVLLAALVVFAGSLAILCLRYPQ